MASGSGLPPLPTDGKQKVFNAIATIVRPLVDSKGKYIPDAINEELEWTNFMSTPLQYEHLTTPMGAGRITAQHYNSVTKQMEVQVHVDPQSIGGQIIESEMDSGACMEVSLGHNDYVIEVYDENIDQLVELRIIEPQELSITQKANIGQCVITGQTKPRSKNQRYMGLTGLKPEIINAKHKMSSAESSGTGGPAPGSSGQGQGYSGGQGQGQGQGPSPGGFTVHQGRVPDPIASQTFIQQPTAPTGGPGGTHQYHVPFGQLPQNPYIPPHPSQGQQQGQQYPAQGQPPQHPQQGQQYPAQGQLPQQGQPAPPATPPTGANSQPPATTGNDTPGDKAGRDLQSQMEKTKMTAKQFNDLRQDFEKNLPDSEKAKFNDWVKSMIRGQAATKEENVRLRKEFGEQALGYAQQFTEMVGKLTSRPGGQEMTEDEKTALTEVAMSNPQAIRKLLAPNSAMHRNSQRDAELHAPATDGGMREDYARRQHEAQMAAQAAQKQQGFQYVDPRTNPYEKKVESGYYPPQGQYFHTPQNGSGSGQYYPPQAGSGSGPAKPAPLAPIEDEFTRQTRAVFDDDGDDFKMPASRFPTVPIPPPQHTNSARGGYGPAGREHAARGTPYDRPHTTPPATAATPLPAAAFTQVATFRAGETRPFSSELDRLPAQTRDFYAGLGF